jgi:hypothetical protein
MRVPMPYLTVAMSMMAVPVIMGMGVVVHFAVAVRIRMHLRVYSTRYRECGPSSMDLL